MFFYTFKSTCAKPNEAIFFYFFISFSSVNFKFYLNSSLVVLLKSALLIDGYRGKYFINNLYVYKVDISITLSGFGIFIIYIS